MGKHFQVKSWGKDTLNLLRYKIVRFGRTFSFHPEIKIEAENDSLQGEDATKRAPRFIRRQNKLSMPRKGTCVYVLVGLCSIFIAVTYRSYQTYNSNVIKSYVEIIAINKEKVSRSLEALDKAMMLLGMRIEKLSDNPKAINDILNTDFKTIVDGPFPTILSIEFIQAKKAYSRLGLKTFTDSTPEILSEIDASRHVFAVKKEIANLGTLVAKVSVDWLLSDRFSRKDEMAHITASEGFTVAVNGAQHGYYLDRVRPTFWGFLEDFADFFRLLVIASLGFTFFGSSSVYYFGRKHNKLLRSQKEEALQKYKTAYRSCSELEASLVKQKAISLNEICNYQKREELLKVTIDGLQQMASTGLKTNTIVTNVLMQGAAEDKAAAELLKLALQANQQLKHIASGYPCASADSPVNLIEAVNNALEGFKGKILSKGIEVHVKDLYKKTVTTDSGVLSIVLYNLLGCILDKFVSRLNIEITGTDKSGLSIRLEDNRHVSEVASEKDFNRGILALSQKKLSELTMLMGWKISFETTENLSTTMLWLPNEALHQGNVVSFNEYKKNA